jgi:tripartite-type tricarboxylate transporter receptor subunit TctC
VDWHIGVLRKISETPEFKGYISKGALKPAFATGSEYTKWVEENDKLHKELMTKGGLIQK